ncbi:MAG: primosomal protein N' [Candidatus Azobacteroides sp.]|nr:primosomal protein N' [Candidatus Azobacteroides sp.]
MPTSPVIYYIDAILPLPLADFYTYKIPGHLIDEVKIGCRVVVSFGKKKFYTAIVIRIHDKAPEYETKEITSVLDHTPIVTSQQLKLWEWVASYYQCTLGEVYNAALPAGLKPGSETTVFYNPDFYPETELTEKEQRILSEFAAKDKLTLSELQKSSGIKNVPAAVKTLLEKNALLINEEVKQGYKAKTETYLRLSEDFSGRDRLEKVFDELSRAPKQLHVLMTFLDLSHYFSSEIPPKEVSKKELIKKTDTSENPVNSLIEKGILLVYRKEISRLQNFSSKISSVNTLNDIQQKAYSEIIQSFENKDIILLHGVTSGGKTEVYIRLIDDVLKKGRQVLYLLPEIALTTQITDRITKVFGNNVRVYHSKFSDNERVEIWNQLLHDQGCKIVLGVRSSVFLPFKNLGLIIIDEEHENTYKQQDPAPRYHARNTAMILAAMHRAKTLLGTATPSVESYFHAKTGRYGLVKIEKRFEEIELPEIEIVDSKKLYKRKQMQSHFSPLLLEKITRALESNEQIILFQNRRGFAPLLECKLCAWIPKCVNCDVSLTYHKYFNQLVCHYCGYAVNIPELCPACGNPSLVTHGFGTEKIEEEIKVVFPNASVSRMDLDTAKNRASYERIIHDFSSGKTDILIGTQMISKGLDFDHVSVVGILNADNMINYPDFRSHERAFQLMVQVSGRAGRKNKQGTVVIQTGNPTHPVIRQVKENDYEGMFHEQLAERKVFRYPPFTRLIYVMVKHKEHPVAVKAAANMAEALRQVFGKRVLGPDKPVIARIQTYYIQKIILKIETEASQEKVKDILNRIRLQTLQNPEFKSVIIYYDVDPM